MRRIKIPFKTRSKKTESNPRKIIWNALLRHESRSATWPQLKDETCLSKFTLSKYLNMLIKCGDVRVWVDTSKHPRLTVYSLIPAAEAQLPEQVKKLEGENRTEIDEAWKYFIDLSLQSGYQLSKVDDRQKARELLREYLAFNIDVLAANLTSFISGAFSFSKGHTRGKNEQGKRLTEQEQYEIFIKNLKDDSIKKVLIPWMESLAYAGFWNQDIALGEVEEDAVYRYYGIERGRKIDLSKMLQVYERMGKLLEEAKEDSDKGRAS